jgi:SET domain-containing protein
MCDCTDCFPVVMELNDIIDSGKNIKTKLTSNMYHTIRKCNKFNKCIEIGRCPCDTEYLCETFDTETMGIGVRACIDIHPETSVGCYLGCIRKTGEASWVYAFEYGLEGYVVDGSDKRSIMSYVNHSDHPNLNVEYVFHIVNGKKQLHIVFKANKYIHAGEELFIDYGDEYWKYSNEINNIVTFKKQTKITNYFCKLIRM